MSGAGDSRRKTGTFLVTHADGEQAVLRDVHDAEVHTLEEAPDLQAGDVVDATISAMPPLEVVWSIAETTAVRRIPVERSPESPTSQAVDIASAQSVGEVTTREREGEGELHVLTVPNERTESAAMDVLEDDETIARATRLGVDRVEIRADEGVVSVRYLP